MSARRFLCAKLQTTDCSGGVGFTSGKEALKAAWWARVGKRVNKSESRGTELADGTSESRCMSPSSGGQRPAGKATGRRTDDQD